MGKLKTLLIILLIFQISCMSHNEDAIEDTNKIYNFINEGFGYKFDNKRVYGSDIIKQYGNIINYSIEKNYENRDYVIINFDLIKIHIFYNTYVEYFVNNQFDENIFNDFRIRSINGKENVEYLHGIKFDMTFQDFIRIFEEKNSGQDKNEYYIIWNTEKNQSKEQMYLENDLISLLSDEMHMWSKRVDIHFVNNKINSIKWIF